MQGQMKKESNGGIKKPREVIRGNLPAGNGGRQAGNGGGPRGLPLWFVPELALADTPE